MQQYNSCYKQWWKFCKNNSFDPESNYIPNILQFLTEKYHSGAAYGTLNSARSALSLLLDTELGMNKDISRFFKGIYRARPNRPKYKETWDPSVMLDYVSNLYPNVDLDLQAISKKLLILLALTTAQRLQTFSLITVDNISINDLGIKIKVPQLIKTSKINRLQPLLNLPFFKEKESICPARTLIDYLSVTNNLRKDHNSLFITLRKPHSPASTHTLSRWVKDILFEAGIDTEIFSAHSTRHAATSCANRKGLNIDLIKITAGWTQRSNTFAKFYNLPLQEETNFASCIISDNVI